MVAFQPKLCFADLAFSHVCSFYSIFRFRPDVLELGWARWAHLFVRCIFINHGKHPLVKSPSGHCLSNLVKCSDMQNCFQSYSIFRPMDDSWCGILITLCVCIKQSMHGFRFWLTWFVLFDQIYVICEFLIGFLASFYIINYFTIQNIHGV